MSAQTVDDWPTLAKCKGMEDLMFTDGLGQKMASRICAGCPVRTECLAEALDDRIEWGVWGGMTERQRRQLLRRRPQVVSWRRLLCG